MVPLSEVKKSFIVVHVFHLNITNSTTYERFDKSLYLSFSKESVLEQHRKVYFHSAHFTCRSLCSDFIILVLSFLAFSTPLALSFELFTRKHCLRISGLTE